MYVISVYTVLHLPSIWFQHNNCQNWIRPNVSLKYFVLRLSTRYTLPLYMNGIRPTVQAKYILQAILKRIGRGRFFWIWKLPRTNTEIGIVSSSLAFLVLRPIVIIETIPSDLSRVGRQGRETNIKGTAVCFLENIRFS